MKMGRLRNLEMKGLSRLIKTMVQTSELLHPGEKRGLEKRDWVVNLLNQRVVNLPFLNEDQEAILIGALVDLTVDAWQDAKDKWSDAS